MESTKKSSVNPLMTYCSKPQVAKILNYYISPLAWSSKETILENNKFKLRASVTLKFLVPSNHASSNHDKSLLYRALLNVATSNQANLKDMSSSPCITEMPIQAMIKGKSKGGLFQPHEKEPERKKSKLEEIEEYKKSKLDEFEGENQKEPAREWWSVTGQGRVVFKDDEYCLDKGPEFCANIAVSRAWREVAQKIAIHTYVTERSKNWVFLVV